MSTSRDLLAFLNDDRILAALDLQLRLVLARVRAELAAGVTRTSAARVRELMARIKAILLRINPAKASWIRNWIIQTASKSFVLGDRSATKELRDELRTLAIAEQISFGGLRTSFTALNQTSLQGVIAAMTTKFQGIHDQILARVGSVVRETQVTLLQSQKIREATTSGYLRGFTGQQVKDDIASILLRKKISPAVRTRLEAVGFSARLFESFEQVAREELITVGSKTMSVRNYANLVGRTQSREIHKVATVIRLQQNEVDHVRISQHVQADVDECTPYAGKVFYIGGLPEDPAGFPPLREIVNGGPPFHPNCKHVLQPFVVGFKTKKAIDKAKASANALPDRFFGKTAKEIRKLVAEMKPEDLKAIAEEGFNDLAMEAA